MQFYLCIFAHTLFDLEKSRQSRYKTERQRNEADRSCLHIEANSHQTITLNLLFSHFQLMADSDNLHAPAKALDYVH